jgi:hypothetical protein
MNLEDKLIISFFLLAGAFGGWLIRGELNHVIDRRMTLIDACVNARGQLIREVGEKNEYYICITKKLGKK